MLFKIVKFTLSFLADGNAGGFHIDLLYEGGECETAWSSFDWKNDGYRHKLSDLMPELNLWLTKHIEKEVGMVEPGDRGFNSVIVTSDGHRYSAEELIKLIDQTECNKATFSTAGHVTIKHDCAEELDRMNYGAGINIMVTGHRPNKLWGYNMEDPHYWELRKKLRSVVMRYAGDGRHLCLINGMALGVDQIFCELSLELRAELGSHRVSVTAVIPFKGQEDIWAPAARIEYRKLLSRCDSVICSGDKSDVAAAMLIRNHVMAEISNVGIAVWDGSKSGTSHAIDCLNELRRDVVIIDPSGIGAAPKLKEIKAPQEYKSLTYKFNFDKSGQGGRWRAHGQIFYHGFEVGRYDWVFGVNARPVVTYRGHQSNDNALISVVERAIKVEATKQNEGRR